MIYFDSNVFIYALIYEETVRDVRKADNHLIRLLRGKIMGCTCTLTWDEVFYVVFRAVGINEAVESGKVLLAFPNLTFVDVDFELILEAHKIARESRILPRDAIHAASAIKYCNGEIISRDSGFDIVEGITRRF